MLQTIELQAENQAEQVQRLLAALRCGCCYVSGSPVVRQDDGKLLRRCRHHLDAFYRRPLQQKLAVRATAAPPPSTEEGNYNNTTTTSSSSNNNTKSITSSSSNDNSRNGKNSCNSDHSSSGSGRTRSATALRGYFPIGSESGDVRLFERKESFAFGCAKNQVPAHFLQSSEMVVPNVWPGDWKHSQKETHRGEAAQSITPAAITSTSPLDDLEELHKRMCETAMEMLPLIEAAFAQSAPELPSLQRVAIDESCAYQSFLRSFRYYRHDADALQEDFETGNGLAQNIEGNEDVKEATEKGTTAANAAPTIGSSLHTDWNLLTLVWASSKGLQMATAAGDSNSTEYEELQFEDVHPEEELHLICNFGDFLSSFSQGAAVSPWHRVVSPEQESIRDSFVFFFYPSASCPAITKPVHNLGRPLCLFSDQSKASGTLWDIQAEGLENMGQVYAAKWKQVAK